MHDNQIHSTPTIGNKTNALALVQRLKAADQDHEWYPTTDEIINCVHTDILDLEHRGPKRYGGELKRQKNNLSVLDIGSGDGRVLHALTEGDKYAIEKSRELLTIIHKDVVIVGTDFMQQTLLDKTAHITYSNPPYSEFPVWASKIIRESNSNLIYLVIPSRWKENASISAAIASRRIEDDAIEVIGSFDFLDADRAARAQVDVIRINLEDDCDDAFGAWFDSEFPITKDFEELAIERMKKEQKEANDADTINGKTRITAGNGQLVPVLVNLYEEDMGSLWSAYKQVLDIPSRLLQTLQVSIKEIRDSFENRIVGLKKLYWEELFSNLERITSRLTANERKKMLAKMNNRASVDFTADNIFAIVEWVLKNTAGSYNDQLIDVYESMVSSANIQNYKSNQRVFGANEWRYNRAPDDVSHYKLDLRIVCSKYSAISESTFSFESNNGLHPSTLEWINDLRTVCNNLGFSVEGCENAAQMPTWKSNKSQVFQFNGANGKETLFEAKAFKNGNVHLKFNKNVIARLNVEFGRLKGWITSPEYAAKELDLPLDEVVQAWKVNTLQLTAANLLALTSNPRSTGKPAP